MATKISMTVLLLATVVVTLLTMPQGHAAPFNGSDDIPTKPTTTTNQPPSDQDANTTLSTSSATTNAPTTTVSGTEAPAGQQEVRSCAELTKQAARDVGGAASNLSAFIAENFLSEGLVPMLTPCFAEERGGQEIDGNIRPGVNYLQRIVSDKRALSDFDDYMLNVTNFYNASINEHPTCDYCVRFSALKALTATLMTSLQQLITKARSRGLLAEEETSTQTEVPEHCIVPCFDEQASIYRHYSLFAKSYIVVDIDGFIEQNFDSDKDKQ